MGNHPIPEGERALASVEVPRRPISSSAGMGYETDTRLQGTSFTLPPVPSLLSRLSPRGLFREWFLSRPAHLDVGPQHSVRFNSRDDVIPSPARVASIAARRVPPPKAPAIAALSTHRAPPWTARSGSPERRPRLRPHNPVRHQPPFTLKDEDDLNCCRAEDAVSRRS
jgi:hypothetical protein